jgi:ribosomal protein S5
MKHMKRIKKALNNGRRAHFNVAVVDAWTETSIWEDGFRDIEDAIEIARQKAQEPMMDGPYRSLSVHYQDTTGPAVFYCQLEDFYAIRDYMEGLYD